MEVDVTDQRFVLLRNVATRLEPARPRG